MDRIPIPLLDTFLVLAAHGEQDPACLYASTLGTFRRSSRTMYSALSDGANPVLYAHIFEQRYPDASRIRRLLQHLPPIITTPHSVPLAAELRRRLRTERVFRATHASGSLQDARLPAALCDAYVAVLLDPRALTALRDAHAYDVCKAWLQQRLYDGAEGTAGWAPQTESNAFALALFYMLTTRNALTTESEEERANIMALLEPIAFAAFRYPWSNTAEHSFQPAGALASHRPPSWTSSPDPAAPRTRTQHGPWPPTALPPKTVHLAWLDESYPVQIPVPPMALYAIAAYVPRQGMTPLGLPPDCPPTISDAVALNCLCLSREEIGRYNGMLKLNLPREDGPAEASPTVDAPLSIANFGLFGPPYVLGSLDGSWAGSYSNHTLEQWADMLAQHARPAKFPAAMRYITCVTLREHYAYSPSRIVPLPLEKDGYSNAWIPRDYTWRETEDSLEVFDADGRLAGCYMTYRHMREREAGCNLRALGVTDILVTGETGVEDRAWSAKRFYGRVSMIDGRVMLVAEEIEGIDRWIFRGSVLPCGRFAGRMTMGGNSTGLVPLTLDIVFCLSRT